MLETYTHFSWVRWPQTRARPVRGRKWLRKTNGQIITARVLISLICLVHNRLYYNALLLWFSTCFGILYLSFDMIWSTHHLPKLCHDRTTPQHVCIATLFFTKLIFYFNKIHAFACTKLQHVQPWEYLYTSLHPSATHRIVPILHISGFYSSVKWENPLLWLLIQGWQHLETCMDFPYTLVMEDLIIPLFLPTKS